MTYLLKLAGPLGATPTWDIDMTNMNPSWSYRYHNPLIQIPTPAPTPDDRTVGTPMTDTWAVVTININMSQSMITIKFKEYGGLTKNNEGANIINPTTVYERMLVLCSEPKKKRLYINDSVAEFGEVSIISYTADIAPGSKDIIDHSVTLVMSSTMGD